METRQQKDTLPIGSTLRSQKRTYRIESVAAMDETCITYTVSAEVNTGSGTGRRLFRMREHYLAGACHRDGGHNVCVETDKNDMFAQSLAAFWMKAQNNGTGNTGEVFSANNTMYHVLKDDTDKDDTGATAIRPADSPKHATAPKPATPQKPTPTAAPKPKSAGKTGNGKGGNGHKLKLWHYGLATILCAALAYGGMELAGNGQTAQAEEPTTEEHDGKEPTEPGAEIDITEDTTTVGVLDMQSAEDATLLPTAPAGNKAALMAELKEYLDKAEACCDKAEPNSGSKAMIQVLLDAKYYYYDKARKLHNELYGTDIKRSERIDRLVKREYDYWIDKGHKAGKTRQSYATKKAYYENAYKLVESDRVKEYIDWLDKQLKRRRR